MSIFRGHDDRPIVQTLLDTDFYKFTMGAFIHRWYPDVTVTFAVTNRTTSVRLADIIDERELRAELDHVLSLRFDNQSEIFWLRGMNIAQEHMFPESYLAFLQGMRLPPYSLSVRDGQYVLTSTGPWGAVTYWETFFLCILNELYYRAVLRGRSRFERKAIYAEGIRREREKIEILKTQSRISFIEFGTRRRFGRVWQSDVTRDMAEELPSQFRGTSNAKLAFDYGFTPMGTNAHELQMVVAALADSDQQLGMASLTVLDQWWQTYGVGLSVALTDTFGSDYFFRTFGAERAIAWKGMRQDSGDPFTFAAQLIQYYRELDIDPRTKLLIPSDGLTIETILKLDERFGGQINMSYGWGTTLTNDLGLKTLSIVAKAVQANGRPTVKLSDNLAKAMGPVDEIERYKRVFGHDVTLNIACQVKIHEINLPHAQVLRNAWGLFSSL